jgi:large subunit ribosomal protein L32e
MPKIGRGSNKRTRHLLPNGLKKFVIQNEKDLDVLLMNNRTYCAEISQKISSKKRASILEHAKAMNVAVTNAHAKVKKQSAE